MKKLAAFVCVVWMWGCVQKGIGSGGSSIHPPPLPAGAVVPLWDHFCATSAEDMRTTLDEASREGWELVTNDGAWFCFKRPRVEGPPPGPAPAVAPPAQ